MGCAAPPGGEAGCAARLPDISGSGFVLARCFTCCSQGCPEPELIQTEYERMYVCMYVCMSVCLYVCMYVCMYACIGVRMYVCTYVCMYACMHVCVCMYVCIRAWMYT